MNEQKKKQIGMSNDSREERSPKGSEGLSENSVVLPSKTLPDASFLWSKYLAHKVGSRGQAYVQLARWDRPIGWWLLVLPCWWSVALSGFLHGAPLKGREIFLLWIGAVLMRGAGCTYNDIIDRHLDAKVRRTMDRPLPSKRISVFEAWVFLGLQALGALALLCCFNAFTISLGISVLILVFIYPFMKRFTFWPQAVLGAAFSWGALMGYALCEGQLRLSAVFLYLSSCFWVIGYDTIYAVQDLEDDKKAQIYSTARFSEPHLVLFISIFYLLSFLLLQTSLYLAIQESATLLTITRTSGAEGSLPLAPQVSLYLGSCAFGLHLLWQIWQVQQMRASKISFQNARSAGLGPRALELFRSNRTAGLLLFCGMAVSTFL